MTTTGTVYATRTGAAFHARTDCRALLGGQLMNDDHRVFWLNRNAGRHLHRPLPLAIGDAWGNGRTPCTTCLPDVAAAFRDEPSVEDFGHRPVIGFVDGRALNLVCARCTAIKRGPGIWWHASVRWPCTSAVVLGLVPRPASV
ncbi:hypothetical protein [Streptomyces sp. NPDC088736]|uniref:hypothetical protein n=1 Tax=Streptomyces sp. NPDC088736 TaxID=3365881 RepID=UPI0037F9C075